MSGRNKLISARLMRSFSGNGAYRHLETGRFNIKRSTGGQDLPKIVISFGFIASGNI